MNNIEAAKAKLRERNAARRNMTLEQFDAYVIAEQRHIDEWNRCVYDRGHQFWVLAVNATYWERQFIVLY